MFEQMISQFTTPKDTGVMVSKSEYELFCKEYIFEKLKGLRFGEAFCKRFHIRSWTISKFSDSWAKEHIEEFYIK